MLPILFSIGPITFYTFGFLLAIGFFLASFVIWRHLREMGLKEEKIIDFILSLGLFGLFFSRVIYILNHLDQFGLVVSHWFLLVRYPGLSLWGGVLGWGLTLILFSRSQKWSFWRLADEVSFGILPFLILTQLACFFDGCSLGRPTQMFWGVYLPGQLLKRQPVSLFASFGLLVIWFFVLWLERRWRMWNWYQSQEDGLISLIFLGLFSLVNFLLAFWRETKLYFYWQEIILSFSGIILALILIYYRSGRKISKDFNFLVKRRVNEKTDKDY